MRQRILVTGGAGYLGSILCERLLSAGHAVTALDNLMHNQRSLFHLCAHPDFRFVYGDVRDKTLVSKLARSADAVLPLAAIVGAPACDQAPSDTQTINYEAIRLLCEILSPSQRVIIPVTNSGYGAQSGQVFCTEDTPLQPISLYGQTKIMAEKEMLKRENTISLRLATVFGMSPRMRLDLLVNHFTYAAVTDGYLVLFEKNFMRNYIHIRDIADCFCHCLEHFDHMAGRPYNVGLDAANLSKLELAEKIHAHVPNLVILCSDLGTDPDKRNYIVSNQRLREAGFEARRSLDDGISELLKGYAMLGRSVYKNVPDVVGSWLRPTSILDAPPKERRERAS